MFNGNKLYEDTDVCMLMVQDVLDELGYEFEWVYLPFQDDYKISIIDKNGILVNTMFSSIQLFCTEKQGVRYFLEELYNDQ